MNVEKRTNEGDYAVRRAGSKKASDRRRVRRQLVTELQGLQDRFEGAAVPLEPCLVSRHDERYNRGAIASGDDEFPIVVAVDVFTSQTIPARPVNF